MRMTEAEWLKEQGNSQWMICELNLIAPVSRTKRGKRKLRLFACECCRLIWERLHDPRLRKAVEVAERFADGEASKDELAQVRRLVTPLRADGSFTEGRHLSDRLAIELAVATTDPVAFEAAFSMTMYQIPLAGYRTPHADGEAIICELLRCVFGSPFRPATFESTWRTSQAVAIARTAYEERCFDNLPILADALEEAGCTDEAVLSHLRGPGPHARGCWVVDLVLGRS